MTRTRRALWAGAVAAVVAVSGCAGSNPRVAPVSAGDDMVIELSVGGGLAPPAVRVSDSLPRVWIGGDGRYLRQSAEGAAAAALPTLEERRISQDALAGLVEQARSAGLLAENPDYGTPLITDAMVTRVVIVSGGARHEVLVSALGYPNPGLDDTAMAARAKLSHFVDALQHPERIAGTGAPETYQPKEIAVFVLEATDSSADKDPATWPLGDLSTAGDPTDWPAGSARCLVVSGGEVTAVADAAAGAGRFTPWQSGNGLWDIGLRPLLPDEHSCTDVVG